MDTSSRGWILPQILWMRVKGGGLLSWMWWVIIEMWWIQIAGVGYYLKFGGCA